MQKFDSLVTKFLRFIPMSQAPRNGIYSDPSGNVCVAIAGVKVAQIGNVGGTPNTPPQSAIVQIGQKIAANFNATTDQNIPLTLPAGFTRWKLEAIWVNNASISLDTAVGGVYTAAAKGGTAVVANTQVYSGLTAPGDNAAGSALGLTLYADAATTEFNATQTAAGLYLSLTTPQGAPATADVYIFARVFR